jgi:hypothetical protein
LGNGNVIMELFEIAGILKEVSELTIHKPQGDRALSGAFVWDIGYDLQQCLVRQVEYVASRRSDLEGGVRHCVSRNLLGIVIHADVRGFFDLRFADIPSESIVEVCN